MNAIRRLLIATAVLAAVNPGYADVILWGQPTNISGDGDVSTAGVLFGAVHIGAPGTVATTVNGVTFDPFPISSSNGNPISDPSGRFTLSGQTVNGYSGYGVDAAPFNTLSPAYQALLTGGDFGSLNSLQVLTMSRLSPGTIYQFEFWCNDSRAAVRSMVNATAGNTVLVDTDVGFTFGGIGQFAIGTFTADATTQVVNFQGVPSGGTIENAFQLRILTVPEPSSGVLVLAAAAVFVRRRRRPT
jgi:hypothetical protein